MFVRRHRLTRELPADPIGFLGNDYAQTIPCSRERSRATAQPTADDDEISFEFFGWNFF